MIVLRSLGVYLPRTRMSAAAIAQASGLPEWVVRDKLGIVSKTVPEADDHPTAMGVQAARDALARANIPAEAVDVVISITEEYKEYPVWTAGIKLAHDLGATQAYAYDLGLKCGTSVLALKQARDLLCADSSVNTVLIAGGYRNSDLIDFGNPRVRFMFNLAAGGAAAVVQRSARPNAQPSAQPNAQGAFDILQAAILTDGRFSLDVVVPVGGTKAPLNASNSAQFKLDVTDPEGMKTRLGAHSQNNFLTVISQALHKSGYQQSDIAYLALLHMKRSAHDSLLQALGLRPEQSIYLSDYGHIGQVDQFLSLKLAQEAGKLRDGDVVVLAAAGVGYVWNAIVLRWREAA